MEEVEVVEGEGEVWVACVKLGVMIRYCEVGSVPIRLWSPHPCVLDLYRGIAVPAGPRHPMLSTILIFPDTRYLAPSRLDLIHALLYFELF